MRARLLQFVTGTSKVPMNGFAELHGGCVGVWVCGCVCVCVCVRVLVSIPLQVAMVPKGSASRS